MKSRDKVKGHPDEDIIEGATEDETMILEQPAKPSVERDMRESAEEPLELQGNYRAIIIGQQLL